MSNYVRDQFEEEEQLQISNNVASHSQSSNGSPTNTATETAPTDGSAPSKRKKRNLPGNPDPEAEVVALSPRTLMATNRYTCEVCLKGFQRDQNLQLHRRGHNLPWKLKQRPANEPLKKRVYICPEPSCVHHEPARALGDLTGIKKHFCRKHGEKKWKCDKCSKRYAVQSDWKAHAKICGTREYQCDCGTIFSRKDSFVTHRAFCDALTDENNKMNLQNVAAQEQQQFVDSNTNTSPFMMSLSMPNDNFSNHLGPSLNSTGFMIPCTLDPFHPRDPRPYDQNSLVAANSAYTSATALLQKAAEMGAKISDNTMTPMLLRGFSGYPPVGQVGPSLSGQVGYITSDPTGHHNIGPVAALPEGTEFGNSLFMGGNEKLTVDFLGVDHDHAKRSYEADHGFHSDW